MHTKWPFDLDPMTFDLNNNRDFLGSHRECSHWQDPSFLHRKQYGEEMKQKSAKTHNSLLTLTSTITVIMRSPTRNVQYGERPH